MHIILTLYYTIDKSKQESFSECSDFFLNIFGLHFPKNKIRLDALVTALKRTSTQNTNHVILNGLFTELIITTNIFVSVIGS